MRLLAERENEAVELAKRTYGDGYGRLRFPTAAEAEAAAGERALLLERIRRLAAAADTAEQSCHETKVASGALAPGCSICVEGRWSCLFINERCNTHCFYCPAPQDRAGPPMTNMLPFPKSSEYVEYLQAFDFRGVSISGGEPLLSPHATLHNIRAVKRRFGDGIHLWLYTNGTLLTAELIARLREAGLDEIRFDIAAAGYSLDRVRLAAAALDHVTVEIPAIPEDRGALQGMLPDIAEAGVKSLNLHQLRLTPHNLPKLARRHYTFLHGHHVTVLESELAALSLMAYALESGIGPPINYCSSVYKSRHQRAAARRRSAMKVKREREQVTRAGFIRRMKEVPERCGLRLVYDEPRIVPAVTYRNPFVEIALGAKRRIAVERSPASPELELSPADGDLLSRIAREGETPPEAVLSESLRRALEFELIERGLQEYF